VQFPDGDNRGRAFPFKDTKNQFLGPAIVDGKTYRVMLWQNTATNGNVYFRMVFEPYTPEEVYHEHT
jgi:hypothetical protein